MTSAESGPSRSGLVYILGATVVAGALGYLIQAIVPAFTTAGDYVAFTVFWSAVYLVVAAIAGIQQEVTRAARPRGDGPSGRRDLLWFGVAAATVFALAVVATSWLWAPAALGPAAASLIAPLAVAAAAYALIATLSGVFYGARRWRAAAGLTVSDAGLRLLTTVLALALGAGIVGLGWAVAVPFALAVVLMWFLSGRRAVDDVALDVTLGGLVRNSASTVGGSLATGVMISGLPLLLGITAQGLGKSTLAALILVITLTRAPLVVPLLALQSYLVVTFRDAPQLAARRTLTWGAALLGATAVLAVAGASIGPWIVDLLYSGRFDLPAPVYAGVIAGAGLTAALCLTGAGALAAGHHGIYVGGWGTASGALLVALFAVPAGIWPVVGAIAGAPVIGIAVHLTALRRRPVPTA